jgi:hypothetical protein
MSDDSSKLMFAVIISVTLFIGLIVVGTFALDGYTAYLGHPRWLIERQDQLEAPLQPEDQ